MTQRIYKYPLTRLGLNEIQMPHGAVPLHIGEQEDVVTIWCRVVVDRTLATRRLYMVGTGHDLTDVPSLVHLGSVNTQLGYVWHVFDDGESPSTVEAKHVD